MLDLGDAEQRRDDGERLVEAGDRAIRHRLQLLERSCVVATPREACTHAGQRRAEVMRDVVADAGYSVDQGVESACGNPPVADELWSDVSFPSPKRTVGLA